MQNSIVYCELAPLSHDVTCSKLEIWRSIGDKKLSVEHTHRNQVCQISDCRSDPN